MNSIFFSANFIKHCYNFVFLKVSLWDIFRARDCDIGNVVQEETWVRLGLVRYRIFHWGNSDPYCGEEFDPESRVRVHSSRYVVTHTIFLT